jgi:SAM-dependent methyltransferase
VPETAANAVQIDYWNTTVGRTWAQFQEQLDRQISPLGLEALRVLGPQVGERVLDVGCGCGQTTLELANRVGSAGHVTGIDISEPMLEVARRREIPQGVIRPEFLSADAQTAELGEGVFDAVFSRFGVMFFSDPSAAFANLRKALKPDGRLAFVCWRPYAENLWMRAPMEAAQPLLPTMPTPDPAAPGPFAFADPQRVVSILQSAGYDDVTIEPFDALIGGASIEDTLKLTFQVGPLGSALRAEPELALSVGDAVRGVLKSFETPRGIMMPAAVWIVQARR